MTYASFVVLALASVVPVSGALALFEPAVDASSPPLSLAPLAPIDPELEPSPEPTAEHDAEVHVALPEPALARVAPLARCASVPLAPVMPATPVGGVDLEQAGAVSAARAGPHHAMIIGKTPTRKKLSRNHVRVAFGVGAARNSLIIHITSRRRLVCPEAGIVQHECVGLSRDKAA
jgi:hypothetical protein